MTTPVRGPLNPFLIPGSEVDPVRPLCPWEDDSAIHEKYYVDIDHVEKSFEDFKNEVANLTGLVKNGRLLIVTGQQGCGKSSLLNRCAYWLRTEFAKPTHNISVQIIDLTRSSGENESVSARMSGVAEQFADQVLLRDFLAARTPVVDIATLPPRRLYSAASPMLRPGIVLLVLLPPIFLIGGDSRPLLEELQQYARLTAGRIVFMAEVTTTTEDFPAAALPSVTPPPIILTVSPLNNDDGLKFAEARQNYHRGLGYFPEMTRETMLQIITRERPVKFLQNLLFGVYEDRKSRNCDYTPLHEVTYPDITDYFYNN